MGVKGLSSLLKGKSMISTDFEFKDDKLVVDGSNLVYELYFTSNLDQNHGGEYLAYQVQVQAFFKKLADCGIKPYVVMDGDSGTSGFKLDTIMDRARDKVRKTHDAAETGSKKGILPTLTKLLFQQTLSDMKVPLVKCFGEADSELAALACEWCCPVLSNDSDFYIYDLPAGFLLMDHFKWDEVRTRQGKSYIPCKQYTTTRFCNFFHINCLLLPIFASLAGNDYVALKGMQWTHFLPGKRQWETSWQAGLEGLLVWLRSFRTPEETMTALMKLRPNMSQEEQTKVRMAMLEYQLPNSYLQAFFTEGTIPSLPAEALLRSIPDWIRAPLARGEISGDILDLLVHGRHKLQPQVEHSDRPSSNFISQPIWEAWYGLLLGKMVEEGDRDGLDLVSVKVKPMVQGAALTLRLDSLPQADQAVRLQVCLETLGVEETTLEGVPAHLRLPVAVTRYWQRRAKPDQTLLKALLMVMVQGELNRQRAQTTGWQGDTNHFPQPLDPVVAHSFNQWQICMMDASKLNQLLCTPLPRPHYAWLFQGRLVHQRMRELQEGTLEVHSADFKVQDQSLLEAVLQPDPGARGRTGGPEAQLTHRMDHLHLNNQDEEEEELDQGLDRPKVSVKTRYRTKERKDKSRNSELWRKNDREGWE